MRDTCKYKNWYKKSSDDSTRKIEEKDLDDLPSIPPLEGKD